MVVFMQITMCFWCLFWHKFALTFVLMFTNTNSVSNLVASFGKCTYADSKMTKNKTKQKVMYVHSSLLSSTDLNLYQSRTLRVAKADSN